LNSIAVNAAIDYCRRWKRQRDRVDIEDTRPELLLTDDPVVELRLDDVLVRRRVQEALEEVSVKQRTAFVLRYLEDMPLPEIARALGCREGTVRTHIHRCLLSLRAKLAVKLKQ
jgi:RNA polymerase sigma factor (sigma-70 family)